MAVTTLKAGSTPKAFRTLAASTQIKAAHRKGNANPNKTANGCAGGGRVLAAELSAVTALKQVGQPL